ncbi:uncharacterized protein LOC130965424 [Arachis stenosperma]|uniref:uncharacterized protein LOC130965424 n=1 Tax=Arachis stenosperma TaxID=217475 RepID=UPI0025ABFD90|nr:uncharacterized protein LOC130965424 [Arachis stenosperma]
MGPGHAFLFFFLLTCKLQERHCSAILSLFPQLQAPISSSNFVAHCVLSRPSFLPLSVLVSLTVSGVVLKLIVALLVPVSFTVFGLALSRNRAPFLPSSSLAADAASPGICLRHSLSHHRLAVNPTPSFRSQSSRPLFATIPLDVPNSKQVVEVYPEQRKNQQVLVENSPTPTPPLLPPPETDHLCGFEGDGAGLPSCVQGHALDSNGLISHSMGHMDLCSFLQGLFQQGIMGVKLFVEKMEVIRKQVSELESELNEERSARKKAEGKVAEMEKELASARRDCDKMDSYYHHESKRLLEA